MKTLILGLALAVPVVSSFALQAPVASSTTQAAVIKTQALQVVINVPPSMRPIRDDDVADFFGARVVAALQQQGYKNAITYLSPTQAPVKNQPLLEVNLIEWRQERIGGFVNCTFSANLETPGGNKDLGLFSGMGLSMLSRMDPFTRFEPFDDAAHQATSDLYQRVMATKLLNAATKTSM